MSGPDQDVLRAFYERRHPAYADLVHHWYFLEAAYRGGRAWFETNIFRYYKEGSKEFKARLDRAYRFNHTREVVELVQKYLFKASASRNSDAPQVIVDFWKKATLSGLPIDQLMRSASVANSIGGRVAIVVDNNFVNQVEVAGEGGQVRRRALSIAEAKQQKFSIYAYLVATKDILDYAWDEDGSGGLLWIKLRETVRDDADPIHSSGDLIDRVRLWTRTDVTLFEERDTGQTKIVNGRSVPVKTINVLEHRQHDLGMVPVVLADHTIGEDPYRVPGLIDDIAYLDRAVANYLSNLDAIIQDQTFSQLAIPAQSLLPGEDAYKKMLEMGTKRVFVFDASAGSARPEYLSPDPKQAGVILTVINKIINEIYHTIGLAGERTKEDNAVGIDNSSGVAKAYDFERVNSLLLSKAQSCESVENKLINIVLAWAGEAPPKDKLVSYPTTFDVMRLVDDLVTAEALAKLAAPVEVRREQMRGLVDKLFPQLKADLRSKLAADIETWLDDADIALTPPTNFGSSKPAASPNRQGEVTADTPSKTKGAASRKAS
ncbi:hypothetical protein [Ancylobacter rudongensis]|uniref:Bacteriophage head to tail connecting protein n=1 Tax=Ancylobacter rudongensis TaxID=177413 RepID=A0A1G4US55_9HYPH|nr:hypothetical protein [Ancylobacter rudongensis]SCW95629.1 hypothetical protein SAMN05660859_0070 [Ancylobacter rudongensis]